MCDLTDMQKSFVNLANARRPHDPHDYERVIREIVKDGVCPFCPKYLKQYHKKPFIKTGRYWLLTENMYPYKGARHHLLLVHKRHIQHMAEILPAAWKELRALAAYAVKKRRIRGGALVMRFGAPSHTGASVSHLHANIIAGSGAVGHREPILFRVG